VGVFVPVYDRISITLPRDVLAAADMQARALDRSRSWLVAEALRRYLRAPSVSAPGRVSEPAPVAYAAREVAEARTRHLAAEMQLPAEERLLRAEQLGQLARQAQRRGRRQQVIAFDTYEDFYEWKKAHLVGA
jgi:hypothetical protein